MRCCSCTALVAAAVAGVGLTAAAQDTDEMLFGGVPVENAVVERDFALRLRLEAQVTDDSDEIVDTDVNYARFPTRLYSGEAKIFQNNRATYAGTYSLWENDQDLDVRSWAWKMRIPVAVEPQTVYDTYDTGAGSFLTLQYRVQSTDTADGDDTLTYYSVGVDRFLENGAYVYLQYRHSIEEGSAGGHQISEYGNWKLSNRFKIGEQAAVSREPGRDDLRPWYLRLFWTAFLVEEETALRMETRYYESGDDDRFQEVKTHLYQRVGSRSLVRLSHRYYTDNRGRSSNAWGIKAKRYFSPAFSAHIGYRYYDHSLGTDFDTFFAGLSLLL